MGLKELPMRRIPIYGVQRLFEVPKRSNFELSDEEENDTNLGVTITCNNNDLDCYSKLPFNEF